ncbi:MAG: hypothetical protein M3450_16490 [Actinomycetota bacterium]|nr:hypothetical protein [Actinomycetota bacterium]
MPDPRRSTFAAIVASLVLVVLSGGVVSAAAVGGRPGSTDVRVRAAGAGASALGADVTSTTTGAAPLVPVITTAAPTTAPTTARPPATTVSTRRAASGPATTSSGPVVRSTPANFGSNPGAVEFPHTAGRTSWTGLSNGVTITVRTDTPTPRAGDLIGFEIEASTSGAACCGITVWFGDGFGDDVRNSHTCPLGSSWGPGPSRHRTSHTYNVEGRWTFGVYASTPDCGPPAGDGQLFAMIDVAPGTTTAQGPSLPQVLIDRSSRPPGHEDDYSWVSMAGQVLEEDGWIRTTTLDWGDGSPALSLGGAWGPTTCEPTPAGWPAPNRMVIVTGKAVHHYAAPGNYTITLTAVSTACDGKSAPQTGIGTHVWQVPA